MSESHFQSNDRELLVKLNNDMDYMKASVTDIKVSLQAQATFNKDNYVTQDQFLPIRNLTYGAVGLILTSVIGAIIALVLQKGSS